MKTYEIAGFVVGLVIVFLLIQSFSCLMKIISDWKLKKFSLKHQLDFEAGSCYEFSSRRYAIISGLWKGYSVKITYSYSSIGFRYITFGNLHISLQAQNPSKNKLRITKIPFIERHKKRTSFFKDEWDTKLLVESNPVKFGRALLSSEEFRKRVYTNERTGAFDMSHPFISIFRNGEINIRFRHTPPSIKRITKLLSIAVDLAKFVSEYNE